jgi:hypothetical protein
MNKSIPKFRIKKYPKGWAVEVKKKKLFFTYWAPYICAAGLDGLAWHFYSYEHAKADLLYTLKTEVEKNLIMIR